MTKIERAGVRRRKGAPAPKKTEPTIPEIIGIKPGIPEYIRGVLFGPPKTGKTTAACGSSDRILLLSFDPDGHATKTLIGRDNITVVPIKDKAQLDGLIKKLHAGAVKQFDWIIVDSLTFLFHMIGGKAIANLWADNKNVMRQYGNTGGAVIQVLHDLFALDVNLIITAHLERESEEDMISMDQELGEREVKVAITPMVWKFVGPAVSFIGRTYKRTVWDKEVVDGKKVRNKRTEYVVSYDDGERSPAGSRLPMLAEYQVTDTWLTDLATQLKGA